MRATFVPSHRRSFLLRRKPSAAILAASSERDKAIMGIFDEGCMGMYNAIIPDELLHAVGVFKERLSQSALYAEMRRVTDATMRARYAPGWTERACSFKPAPIRERSYR